MENYLNFQNFQKLAPECPGKNSGFLPIFGQNCLFCEFFKAEMLTKISEISTHYEQIETDGVQSYGTMYQDISSHSDVGNLMPVTSVYSVSDGIQTNEPYQEPFNFAHFSAKIEMYPFLTKNGLDRFLAKIEVQPFSTKLPI